MAMQLSGESLRELGVLQEVNRTFLHPLGLRLVAYPDGACQIEVVSRATARSLLTPGTDVSGFSPVPQIEVTNAKRVLGAATMIQHLIALNSGARRDAFGGHVVQPLPDEPIEVDRFKVMRLVWLAEQVKVLMQKTYTTTPIPGGPEVEHRGQLLDHEVEQAKEFVDMIESWRESGEVGDVESALATGEELFAAGQPGMRYFRGGDEEYEAFDAARDRIQENIQAYKEGRPPVDKFLAGDLPIEELDLSAAVDDLTNRVESSRTDHEREMFLSALERIENFRDNS